MLMLEMGSPFPGFGKLVKGMGMVDVLYGQPPPKANAEHTEQNHQNHQRNGNPLDAPERNDPPVICHQQQLPSFFGSTHGLCFRSGPAPVHVHPNRIPLCGPQPLLGIAAVD
ncbi:hypothetical protein DSCOOX_20640 [Desulfosarcina ovata subsp. ovata]|uniref:Uncharacterized protein n=1 Tax=Desulfosarcina ovata subsp. ovata TaxID=2752305 RepID=A0A5K8A9M0_9BACT|nr:hypothetical protein DSCOOX_20640 [Desulfosarcina ovata subsp. ovata]